MPLLHRQSCVIHCMPGRYMSAQDCLPLRQESTPQRDGLPVLAATVYAQMLGHVRCSSCTSLPTNTLMLGQR